MTIPKDSLLQPSSLNVLLALGLAVLLGGGLLLYAAPDSASTADDPPTLINHLRTELRSTDAERQDRALSDVVALASCTDRCTVSLQSAEDRALRVENEADVGRAFVGPDR